MTIKIAIFWSVVLIIAISIVTVAYNMLLLKKKKHGERYMISTLPIIFLVVGAGEVVFIICIILYMGIAGETNSLKDQISIMMVGMTPLIGMLQFYCFLQSFEEIDFIEKYFIYRDGLLRKHKLGVTDCLWYEEVNTTLRVTLYNKTTVTLADTAVSLLLKKNNIERLNSVFEFNKKRREGSEKYYIRVLRYFAKDNIVELNKSKRYLIIGVILEVPLFILTVAVIWNTLFNNMESQIIYDIILFFLLGVMNIGLIAMICKSLFWHIYLDLGKNSFIYQPSIFRKITVYYRDCEWYSIKRNSVILKTKFRKIKVFIPDVLRADALVMMLVINGVEER